MPGLTVDYVTCLEFLERSRPFPHPLYTYGGKLCYELLLRSDVRPAKFCMLSCRVKMLMENRPIHESLRTQPSSSINISESRLFQARRTLQLFSSSVRIRTLARQRSILASIIASPRNRRANGDIATKCQEFRAAPVRGRGPELIYVSPPLAVKLVCSARINLLNVKFFELLLKFIIIVCDGCLKRGGC